MYCVKVEEGRERAIVRYYQTGFLPTYKPALLIPPESSEYRRTFPLNTKGIKKYVVPGYVFMLRKDPRSQLVNEEEWKIIEAISNSQISILDPAAGKITSGPLTAINHLITQIVENRVRIKVRLLGEDRKYWLQVSIPSGLSADIIKNDADRKEPESFHEQLTDKQKTVNKYKDHKGIEYPSIKAMAKAYGLPYSTVVSRRAMGWDWERTLTSPYKRPTEVKDHLGNSFPSLSAMAESYKLNLTTLEYRLAHNWDLKTALVGKQECQDHKGSWYPGKREMCRAYGISFDAFKDREKRGWDLEKILTTPVQSRDTTCTDHLGNEYPSKKDMADAYGIPVKTLTYRLENGSSLEEALTVPVTPSIPCVTCLDHLGNEYPSKSAMAKAYGITYQILKGRLQKKGRSLEEALTMPIDERKRQKKV